MCTSFWIPDASWVVCSEPGKLAFKALTVAYLCLGEFLFVSYHTCIFSDLGQGLFNHVVIALNK